MVMSLRKKAGYRQDADDMSPYYSNSSSAAFPSAQAPQTLQSAPALPSVPAIQSAPAPQDWSKPWVYSRESAAALYNNPASLGLPNTPGVPGSLFFANGVVMQVGTRTSPGLGGGTYTGAWGNPDGPGAIGNARSDAVADYYAQESRQRYPDSFGADGRMLSRDQLIQNRAAAKAGLPLPNSLYDQNVAQLQRREVIAQRYPVGSDSYAAYIDDTDGTISDYELARREVWQARQPPKEAPVLQKRRMLVSNGSGPDLTQNGTRRTNVGIPDIGDRARARLEDPTYGYVYEDYYA